MRVRMELSPAGVLLAKIEGEFELQEAIAHYREVVLGAARHEASAVLLDCRSLTGSPGDMERYHFGVAAAASHTLAMRESSNAPRVALLGGEPLLDRRRFGETVASNRGAMVRVFGSVEAAAEWLGVSPGELTLADDS